MRIDPSSREMMARKSYTWNKMWD